MTSSIWLAQPDPQGHNGLYSNSWLSYAWQAARLMNAELHDIATGGMALLDKTGYFFGPDYIGLESAWDKVNYYPPFGESTPWDFTRWTPHVVVVAIGQNDHNPVNIMAEDYDSAASVHWRAEYRRFLGLLREKYPKLFLLVDGLEASNANARNASFAFDNMGYGALVCCNLLTAWIENPSNDPVEEVVAAAQRMKRNVTTYVTVL